MKIDPSGKVTVMTGASPHGQGEETTFAQIAADELGVDIDDILVLHGDTAIVQYGIGTFGSRGTAVGGTALYFALQDLKAKIKKFGAFLLESDDVTLDGGQVVCNKTGASKSLQEIAGATYRAMKLPVNTEPGCLRRISGSLRISRSRSARTSSYPISIATRARSRSGGTSRWTIAAIF